MAYDAFISYSHAADDALAPSLQRGLQTLARPWNRRRALEVFRDDTGLAVSPGLWSSIVAALDESDYFVLLASPEAAASTWVNREIDHWVASHSVDHLLPVVTDGEWIWDSTGDFDWDRSTAVPPALRGLFTEEPRHLDLQWARTETELDLRNSRFREAIAQLAAPMHSMTPEDLESADVANYRHVVRLRRGVVIALTVLLVLVSVAGFVAIQNTREAQRAQASADQSRQEAENAADRAVASGLLVRSDSLRNRQTTLSLLLGIEASRLWPDQAWGSVVDGLRAAPGLTTILDLPAGVSPADSFAVDPAADTVAVAVRGEDIAMWNLRTGKRLDDKKSNDDLYPRQPSQLVFSRTGALAARYDCTLALCDKREALITGIQLWDPGSALGQVLPRSDGYLAPTFSPSGDHLAAYTPDGRVRVWDTDDATVVAGGRAAQATPTGVALSPDGTTLALGTRKDGRISIWEIARNRLTDPRVVRLPGSQFPAELALGSRGVLVSRDQSGTVGFWDSTSGSRLGTLPREGTATVVDLALALNGTLATADSDGFLQLWDADTRTETGTSHRSGSRGAEIGVAFTPDGNLVSTGLDIRLWGVDEWGQTGSILYRHDAAVTAVAVSQTGTLVSGDEAGVVALSTLGSNEREPQLLQTNQGELTAVAVTDIGVVATGGRDGTIHLWDAATATSLGTLPGSQDEIVTTLAFTSDGATLAAGYGGTAADQPAAGEPLRVWDVAARKVIKEPEVGLAGDVSAVTFSSQGLLASAGSDNVTVHDPSTWATNVAAPVADGQFSALAFSPDGGTLAFSGLQRSEQRKGAVLLWDPDTRAAVGSPLVSKGTPGWDGRFVALSYRPDGSLLAGAGAAGVQLWDVASQEQIGGLLGPSGATGVVVSPDGESIIAGDEAGAVTSYPATIDGWQTAACAVVSRNLTRTEWSEFVDPAEPYRKTCPQY